MFFNLALNHTWISLLIFVIVFQPHFAHRLSPVISAVAGFAGGFFVPPVLMPLWSGGGGEGREKDQRGGEREGERERGGRERERRNKRERRRLRERE